MRASRGLKWENKTYKLKRSIVTMTVQLTKSRKQKLKNACLNLINKETCTVQNVAEVRNWADRVKFSRGETCPCTITALKGTNLMVCKRTKATGFFYVPLPQF